MVYIILTLFAKQKTNHGHERINISKLDVKDLSGAKQKKNHVPCKNEENGKQLFRWTLLY